MSPAILLTRYMSFVLFFTFVFLLFTFSSRAQDPAKDTAVYDTLSLAVVGDLMCHAPQFTAAKKDSTYDFRSVYTAVKPYLEKADIALGNLETVTAGVSEKFTGYPQFNTPVEYLDGLKDAGFDVLTTANNHSLDRRFTGVERTIEALEEKGFMHTGSFRTEEERRQILIVEKNNIRLAVLAYTYGTNGIPFPEGKKFCVNLIDTALMRADIAKAKSMGCDHIAVSIHWGDEYQRQPNAKQVAVAAFLRRVGVHIVLGSHPHVLQPMERSMHPDSSFFAIYSMGNFISGQRKPYTESGVIVRLMLLKNKRTGSTRIGGIDFIPTYVSTQSGYKVLPVMDALHANEISAKNAPAYSPLDQSRLLAVWQETTSHLTRPAYRLYPVTALAEQ